MFKTSSFGLLLAVALFAAPSFAATWTAQNVVAVRDKGDVTVSADILKDGVLYEKFSAPHLDPNVNPKDVINGRLATLYNLDTFDVSKLGTVTYVPPIPVVKTQQQIDREKFLVDYRVYIGMQLAIKANLMNPGDKAYSDQLALIKSEWLVEYAPYIVGLNF